MDAFTKGKIELAITEMKEELREFGLLLGNITYAKSDDQSMISAIEAAENKIEQLNAALSNGLTKCRGLIKKAA